jgi:SNF family Na+-dependent transporter
MDLFKKKNSEIPITDSQQTFQTDLLDSQGSLDGVLSSQENILESNPILAKKIVPADDSIDEDPVRGKWERSHEFVFALAGCAIGLGNVWRFPYLCYKYGGGSFMVAYLFFLFLVGVPMLMLEVTMGQFMSRGGIEVWNMVPISKGIGFATLLVVVYINIYYIVILAWTLFYFFKSVVALFTGHLPWTSCDFKGASECCSNIYNGSTLIAPEGCSGDPIYPEAEYFSNNVLNITSGIDETGGMNWTLFGFLILAWVIVFSMVYKGVKSTGKAAYVTSTFPLLVLMALVIRGVTLDGAYNGLKYYITPDLDKLAQADTWMAAASQIMFSYSLCQGSLTSLGSYNKWSFNSIKWTVKLSFLNSFASMFAGIAIFSILGHLSSQTGIPIEKVADKGPGLAFIAYPRALSTLRGSAIWNTLFFLMLIMLGIASQCAQVEGMITTIVDLKQNFFKATKPIRRQLFVALACFVCFLLALPMVLNSGMYYFQLMDSYGASGMALMIITILEVVSVAWIYGADKYYDDLEEMCYLSRARGRKNKKSNPKKQGWRLFKYIWKFITPSVLLLCLIYSIATFEGPSYDSLVTGHYEYPTIGWVIAFGLVCSTVCCIPIYALILLCKIKASGNSYKIMFEPEYPADHPRMIMTSSSGHYYQIHSPQDGVKESSRSENIVKDVYQNDTIVKESDGKEFDGNFNDNIHKQRLNSISSPDLANDNSYNVV